MKPWWVFQGPSKKRDASRIFSTVNVKGAKAVSFRRLFRIGPFSFCIITYGSRDN